MPPRRPGATRRGDDLTADEYGAFVSAQDESTIEAIVGPDYRAVYLAARPEFLATFARRRPLTRPEGYWLLEGPDDLHPWAWQKALGEGRRYVFEAERRRHLVTAGALFGFERQAIERLDLAALAGVTERHVDPAEVAELRRLLTSPPKGTT